MSEITVTAEKFLRILDYIERIGLDPVAIASTVNLRPERLAELDANEPLPALQYSRLYKATVLQMQKLKKPLPWAAGLGSEAFELMCHCIIGAKTLGDALRLASRYDHMLYPMLGYKVQLVEGESNKVKLTYKVALDSSSDKFAPEEWDRAEYKYAVAHASGLVVWHAICGWLTGRILEIDAMNVAAPLISERYQVGLEGVVRAPIHFDAEEHSLEFSRSVLDRRLVQSANSLPDFLENSVYELITAEAEPASTSAAIKTLVRLDMLDGMPSFGDIAASLHMSESSLRRRLQKENISYQALKDEVRCDIAIDKLLNENIKIADLAEYLGFAEASSFVRSFKGWTGLTPKAYRDKINLLGN
tara:strand:+ start:1339 stop:2418 length:1080 start_codon:yes stop_codon:yes gene_type:complete